MQIWIFFHAGVGGDGFANLLEQSTNIVPIDGETGYWRIHRIVDNQIKFYAPLIDTFGCFRRGQPFRTQNNQLTAGYLDIISKDKTCIVTSHDVSLKLLNSSDHQSIFKRNQVKILLTTKDYARTHYLGCIKNLQTKLSNPLNVRYDIANFDFVLDIDEIQRDWQAVKNLCDAVQLDLNQDSYLQYQDLLNGNKSFMEKNYNVEIYQSNIIGGNIHYELVDVWQPTTDSFPE